MTSEFADRLRYLPEETVCPVCSSPRVRPILDMGDVPVHCNLLRERREEALAAPRGRLLLTLCSRCGHLYNAAFRPGLLHYEGGYENSLHHSPRFQEYAEDLARRLAAQYRLEGRTVLEIGCGGGDFLALLAGLGIARGIGFDPGWEGAAGVERERLTFFREPFTARHGALRPDFVCCRHVLEHLSRPTELLTLLRTSLQPATPVYFEVPDARFILERGGLWDLIYEHCSYFTERSLSELFHRTGFAVIRLVSAFEGQYLQVEAVPSEAPPPGREGRETDPAPELPVEDFRGRFAAALQEWRGRLARVARTDRRAVIWGAGSKGVSFLNLLGVREEIRFAVDLNPRKHGRFLAGTGQEIVPPAFLREYRPDLVIAANPIYKEEIAGRLREMGMAVELLNL